ncbi:MULTISPECIES: hypothetical protein [Pseudomonas]|uniref:Uncharacterized protein n=1 Tax=Pseudomonas fluorescens TaxID=294 RepID=A0A5E6TU32_PSEFL|nr:MULTISPECIES: hypothetical protein [Pseudomonas]VVM95887.1 hypothetical protein PS652_03031 [Pseudomonas fluorescens]
MNQLTLTTHQSRHLTGPWPTFAIDAEPLEVWLPHHDPNSEYHLVSAQWGLYDDDALLAWDRLYCIAPGWHTLVPLLVCADDLDLSCTVIVAEQVADEQTVHWRRFGLLRDPITEPEPAVDWFAIPATRFDRAAFLATVDQFRSETDVKMEWD